MLANQVARISSHGADPLMEGLPEGAVPVVNMGGEKRWVQIVIADDDTAHLAQVWDEHYTEHDREYHGGVWSRKVVSEEEAQDLLIDLDSEVVEWVERPLDPEDDPEFFEDDPVVYEFPPFYEWDPKFQGLRD